MHATLPLIETETLDITGGAPELNPHFRHLVREARLPGTKVIDRCNLTVLEELDHDSVDWQGYGYDCDFNQMLGIPLRISGRPRVKLAELIGRDLHGHAIGVGDHCYGCTAGQGSSCGGALAG